MYMYMYCVCGQLVGSTPLVITHQLRQCSMLFTHSTPPPDTQERPPAVHAAKIIPDKDPDSSGKASCSANQSLQPPNPSPLQPLCERQPPAPQPLCERQNFRECQTLHNDQREEHVRLHHTCHVQHAPQVLHSTQSFNVQRWSYVYGVHTCHRATIELHNRQPPTTPYTTRPAP
jgi:hypothetical protein